MRIGVDATCWANDRGYGRFTREMVGAMVSIAPHHQFVCFLDERAAASFRLDSVNVERIVVRQSVAPTLAATAGGRRGVGDLLRMSRAVDRSKVDAFFSPAAYGFFPLPPGLPAVVTFHDAIAERFPEMTLPTLRDRLFWRAKMWLALRQADLVLTVSDYAAEEIVRHLEVPLHKIRVTLEGVAAVFRPSVSEADIRAAARRAGVPTTDWLIYVGGFGPHKHVDLLVRAHARVVARHPATTLVLVGAQADGFHEDVGAVHRAIRECGTEDLVRWTGFLPDEELRHLLSGALALVLPSAAEGFGLPAVEAARCGTPVVATSQSPLPQILAGGGMFIRPGDLQALEAAIEQMIVHQEERQEMGRIALQRAGTLSWQKSAAVAIDALETVAGGTSRDA